MAELPTKLALTVVTRERKILETEVDEVVLPAMNGALGVLPGHTPLLAELRIGELVYREGNRLDYMVISWGFAEVLPDRVIVLAEGAIRADEIDREDAERERVAAERELGSLASHDEEFALAQARLEESVTKIHIVTRRHQ